MKTGLSFEILIQLFFIFEGFSFWKLLKLPQNVGLTPSDYNQACENFLAGSNTAIEKAEQILKFKSIYKKFSIWKPIVGFFDNAYLAVFMMLIIVGASLVFDIKNASIQKWCNIILCAYIVLKILLYWRAHWIYSSYQKQMELIQKVDKNNSSIIKNLQIAPED